MKKQLSPQQQQTGFTMIEMLVALVILSVGLLGVAALQTRGQQFNYEAYVYTQATFLAYDLSDRMRGNSAQAQAGNYGGDVSPGSEKKCTTGNSCNAEDLKNYDLTEWFELVEETLPDGKATISSVLTNGIREYTIVIDWAGEDLGNEIERKEQTWVVRI